jgi:sigma-54 dependent transcriptional regulator, acetoin dehydrogenase operon transcriptional activator AcoR
MNRILFLCTNNSSRSQMAEAFARGIATEGVEVVSAGISATGINPYTIKVMAEAGIDISNRKSKNLADLESKVFDVIVTLCEDAQEKCPLMPGVPGIVAWNLPDPVPESGDEPEAQILGRFRQTRDTILRLVTDFFERGYFKAFAALKSNLDAITDNFINGILVHDNNRIISIFNQAAERITGWRAEDVVGCDCHSVFPNGFCGDKCGFCDSDIPEFQRFAYPVEVTTRDGERKSITMSVTPMFDQSGRRSGVIASFRDITRVVELEMKMSDGRPFPEIVSTDKEMMAVFSLIRDIKGSDAPVLILGETGTGKELVARAIHTESRRADNLFVPVNCGALPEGTIESELFGHVKGAFTGAMRDKKGRFELADGGTIFLDEVAELSPAIQVKLLRVLQDGTFERVGGEQTVKVSVRVISASNRDIRQMMKTGAFREDLFYRLCVVPVTLPPLRDRRGDIPLLARYFLDKISTESDQPILSLSQKTIQVMLDYKWPGNIRQLQNALQYATLKCKGGTIEPHHLPFEIIDTASLEQKHTSGRKMKLDSDSIDAALKEAGGNKAKAARILGVGRATLYRFLSGKEL